MIGDVDRLFSYRTKQLVRIPNGTMGFLSNFITVLIIVAIVGYIFIIDKGYLEYEQARGMTVTHVHGDSLAASTGGDTKTRYFSPDEITHPGPENGNVMVATSMEIIKQKRGVCVDNTMPCTSPNDCTPGSAAQCTANGLCKEPSWCPEGSEVSSYKLDTSSLKIWVKSAIQFSRLHSGRYFSGDMTKPILYPQPGFNTFSVSQLLGLCDPPIKFDEVHELGAAIEVRFVWDCDVHKERCLPSVRAQRLDLILPFVPAHVGYQLTYPVYDGTDARELYKVKGIRFYLRTTGTGQSFSLIAVCLKVSMGFALLGLAPMITDMIMLRCLAMESDRLFARKYDMTEDFDTEHAAREVKSHHETDEELDFEEIQWRRKINEDD